MYFLSKTTPSLKGLPLSEMVYLKSWLENHYKDELTEEQIEKILKYVEEWKNKGE